MLKSKEYVGVLFDRLAGTIMLYVEDYIMQKQIEEREINGKSGLNDKFPNLKPSCEVDYKISDEIMECIYRSLDGSADDVWYLKIAICNNIDDIEEPLKTLVVQFLPKFFEMFPQYRGAECLKYWR